MQKPCALFLIFFFFSIKFVGQVDQIIPEYNWEIDENFGTVTQAETSGLPIAIESDSDGNIYKLTFGDGVLKYDSEGDYLGVVIDDSKLNDPLDIAIDSNNNIYVIDFEDQPPFNDNGKIKVFNSEGVQIDRMLTSYYRPIGITINNRDDIYVVIYNDGTGAEDTKSSELWVYDNSYTRIKVFKGTSAHPLNQPYRIAVDSRNNIIISHTSNDGEVLVFNSNYEYVKTLSGVGSPGSVVVDEFDFLYVTDYSDRIDFGQILDYNNLGVFEAAFFAINIQSGIDDNEFTIKIFDQNFNLRSSVENKIDLPVDLCFNKCKSYLYVDNGDITELSLNPLNPKIKIEFDLEIFKRTPTFDQEKPEIECPEDITVTAETGNDFAIVEYENATAIDNCDKDVEIEKTGGPDSGSQFPEGSTEIEFTATDDSGNTSICTFTITVNPSDDPEPSVNCPDLSENLNLLLDENCRYELPDFENLIETSDLENTPYFEIDTLQTDFELEVNVRVYDGENGDLIGECDYNFALVDTIAPVASCKFPVPAPAIYLENGVATVPDDYINNGSTDNCGILSYELSQSTFTEPGPYLVTMIVTDFAGNTDSCQGWITVLDNTESSLTCVDSYTLELDEMGNGFVSSVDLVKEIEGEVEYLIDGRNEFNCDDIGETTIRLRYHDQSNLDDFCDIPLLIVDNIDPYFETCPSDLSENVPFGETGKIVTYEVPAFNDNCGNATLTQTAGLVSGSEFPIGTTTNTFEVDDGNGNTATCSFKVVIEAEEDTEDPVFLNCPDFIIRKNNPGECGGIVMFSEITATDNSRSVEIEQTEGLESGSQFPLGPTTVTFVATDGSGNTATCSFTVTVEDDEAPVISNCPSENLRYTIPEGETLALADYRDQITISDNCETNFYPVQNPAPGTLISNDQEVTLIAVDGAGNESDICSFTIIITEEADTEAPVITCPQNISVYNDAGICGAVVTFSDATATDNVGNPTVTRIDDSNLNSGDVFPVGVTTLTFQAEDEAGNTTECDLVITVEDLEAPVISDCPAPLVESFNMEDGYVVPDFTNDISISDNCTSSEDLRIIQSPEAGDIINTSQKITITVIDEASNRASCEFLLSLEEEQVYEFECIGALTVNLGEDAQNLAVKEIETSEFITSDISNLDLELRVQQFDCDDIGTFSLPIRATDKETGELYSCDVEVTVKDVGAPLIICPAEPITINLPDGGYQVPDFFENRISDNCNGIEEIELQQDVTAGNIINTPGTYTINLTATDTYNNVETCEVVVILEGNTDTVPEISCPGRQTMDFGDLCEMALPDFRSLVTTNPEMEVVQTPEPGTLISYTQQISFTATLNGETASCEIELEVINPLNNFGMQCSLTGVNIYEIDPSEYGIVVNFEDPVVTGGCGEVDIQQTEGPASGSLFPLGETLVKFNAIDEAGNELDCSFGITVIEKDDSGSPTFECPETDSFDPVYLDAECDFEIPDFTNSIINYQNFSNEPFILYSLTRIDQNLEVILDVFDGENGPRIGECRFQLPLIDAVSPVLNNCTPSIPEICLEEGASYSLPDFTSQVNVTDNCDTEPQIAQSPIPGTEINETTEVTITATDASGNSGTCTFNIIVETATSDGVDIQCPIDKNVAVDENCSFTLGDYRSEINIFRGELAGELVQSPEPGTTITDPSVQLSFTGTNGTETDTCYFTIFLRDRTAPILNCKVSYSITISESGTRILDPNELTTGIFDNCDSNVQLSLSQDEFTLSDVGQVDVILAGTDAGGNTSSCTVPITVVGSAQNSVPVANPDTYSTPFETILTKNAAEGVLSNDTDADGDELTAGLLEDVDNGILTLNENGSFTYIPNNGFIGEDTFIYYAFDGLTEVETTVTITVFEDLPETPVANNDTYTVNQDEVLNVSPPGVLENDTAPENNQLFAVIIETTSNGELILNEDGSFTYTPNTGFTGTDSFQYIATNNETGNSEVATVLINVLPVDSGDFNCQERIILELDEAGEATLALDLLYSGNANDITINATQRIFTCENIGENVVTLHYTGSVEGSCEVIVEVVDVTAPILLVQDIGIDLDLNGDASITFEMIDNGSFDTCDNNVIYTLSRTDFSCKYLGANEITVTATDASGNSTSETIIVTVYAEAGICSTVEGSDYVFVYPNPNTGSFKVATPTDVTISRIEVFDNRGRFIIAKNYDSTVLEYAMDLGPLQEAIYILKIITNKGNETRRMIFKY